jgi:hypothetical protein
MGIARLLKRIWYGPPLVESAVELRPGAAVVEGTAMASKETLVSPLSSTSCVAYKYRATYQTPSRTQGVLDRLLKEIEVYCPGFELNVDGLKIKVVAKSQGRFDAEEHRKLQSGGFRGFRATESLIRPGNRVRVTGRIRKEGDQGFVLTSRKIELIPYDQGERDRARSRGKKGKKKKHA